MRAGEGIQAWRKLGLRDEVSQFLPKIGFPGPRDIQCATLPLALKQRSFSVIAPTASGKTLSYLLPLIELWYRHQTKSLIVVPTQELADQVMEVMQKLDKNYCRQCKVLRGGVPLSAQAQDFSNQWRTIIGTPGRLLEWLEKRPKLFYSLSIGVWDEYDQLLNLGFKPQLAKIWRQVSRKSVIWCFSATEAALADKENPQPPALQIRLQDKHHPTPTLLPKPLIKQSPKLVNPQQSAVYKSEFLYLLTQARQKNDLIEQLLHQETKGSIIIFAQNRDRVNHLYGVLKIKHPNCMALHGHLKPLERSSVLKNFQNTNKQILIATDLAARGLDTLHVGTIINDSPPKNSKDYLHRAGRSGRKGQACSIHTFVGPDDYITWKKLIRDYPEIPYAEGWDKINKWLPKAQARHKKLTQSLTEHTQPETP